MTDRFFSKNNIHQFIWVIIGLVTAFAGGYILKEYSGDEIVVVKSITNINEDEKILYKALLDQMVNLNKSFVESENYSVKLLLELKKHNKLSLIQIKKLFGNKKPNKDIELLLKEFISINEKSSLKSENANNPKVNNSVLDESISRSLEKLVGVLEVQSDTSANDMYNKSADSLFKLPKNVKGYKRTNTRKLTKLKCPSKIYSNAGSQQFSFFLKDSGLINKASPIFLEVIKLNEENNSLIQLYEEQFELRIGTNNFKLDIEYSKGKYEVYIGFYILNKLEREYPSLYNKSCDFIVN